MYICGVIYIYSSFINIKQVEGLFSKIPKITQISLPLLPSLSLLPLMCVSAQRKRKRGISLLPHKSIKTLEKLKK